MTDATQTAVKAPSKKSQAVAIFNAKLAERAQGLFATNREFRHAVLVAIETQLSVTRASASTMYNASMRDAQAVDATLVLGRDPKKQKPVSTGKRGRPTGSKNKPKEVVVADAATAEPAADTVAVA